MPYGWKEHVLSWVDGPTGLIAIGANRAPITVGKKTVGESVEWHDGDHMREFQIKRVKKDDFAEFRFVDTVGREFVLRPMNLDAYRKHVKGKLSGAQSFKTEDELKQFFTKTIFQWW